MQPAFIMTPVDQNFMSLTEETAKQLAAAILALNETLQKQTNNKSIHDDELWTLEHIAEYCHLSISSIRKIIARPTFPIAITPFGEHGTKLWEQTKVKNWFKQNEGKLSVIRTRR